jgi:hypothetical protein
VAAEMELACREPTVEAQLHGMAHRYLAFNLVNSAYDRLIFQDMLPGLYLSPEHAARLRRSWSMVRDTLTAWIEASGRRQEDEPVTPGPLDAGRVERRTEPW